MVQSLGITVGNTSSYVAAGQGGGIEILLNEYSNRSTPSMVAFTDHCRAIGVDASSNFFMNMKCTVYDFMVLIGRPYKDIQLEDNNGKPIYPFKLEEDSDGRALVVVRHLGQERKFTITQVLAMLLTKLRTIAGDSVDCVISCPQFFTSTQKTELLRAALIAGLNPLQIITDMSAVILNYAYYRTKRDDSHKFVAFVNFGQCNLQSAVALLSPKEDVVRVLAAESEPIGGRDFDRCLAEHFISTHNLKLNHKAHLKLMSSCEKLKKLLSANTNEIPLYVESLLGEDKDFNARIDRATFEKIAQPIFIRIHVCLLRTLSKARAKFDELQMEAMKAEEPKQDDPKVDEKKNDESMVVDSKKEEATAEEPMDQETKSEEAKADEPMVEEQPISDNTQKEDPKKEVPKEEAAKKVEPKIEQLTFDLQTVEIVGGSSRVPAVRQIVQDVFSLVPSTTLNTDEAVARGCVLKCATLHPGIKVRRDVKVLNVEAFTKPSNLSCDKDARRVELELITEDRKYRAKTEARNNLEAYIYSERSKLNEGDQFLQQLSDTLDWLFTDEGENSSEDTYTSKLAELKKSYESRLAATKKPDPAPSDGATAENGDSTS